MDQKSKQNFSWARNSGRPNHLLQMPWIATGVVAGPAQCPRKAVTTPQN